jgi:hypothetical protein
VAVVVVLLLPPLQLLAPLWRAAVFPLFVSRRKLIKISLPPLPPPPSIAVADDFGPLAA